MRAPASVEASSIPIPPRPRVANAAPMSLLFRACRFFFSRPFSRSLLASIRPSRPSAAAPVSSNTGGRSGTPPAPPPPPPPPLPRREWRPRILGGDRRASAVDVGGPGGGCDSRRAARTRSRKPPAFVPRPGRRRLCRRASFPAGPCTRWSARPRPRTCEARVESPAGPTTPSPSRRRAAPSCRRPPPDERFRDWSGAGRVVRFLALLLRDGSLGRSPAVANLGGSLPTRLLDALAKRYRDVRPSPAAAAAAAAGRGGGRNHDLFNRRDRLDRPFVERARGRRRRRSSSSSSGRRGGVRRVGGARARRQTIDIVRDIDGDSPPRRAGSPAPSAAAPPPPLPPPGAAPSPARRSS